MEDEVRASPGRAVVLVRFGEIALKGDNRRQFEQALARNLAARVRPLGPFAVRTLYGRMVLEPERPLPDGAGLVERAARAASCVFGVVGAVPALQVPLEVEHICRAARQLVAAWLGLAATGPAEPPNAAAAASQAPPVPFKVNSRRANRQFPLDSLELNRVVGADLLRHFGPRLRVDVHHPRLQVHVEVREREAFVYDGEHPGPGGLPVGVSGRALALVSGGIDSPVAAWMGMKRGLEVDLLHFHAIPFTTQQARDKVVRLAAALARWHSPLRVFMVRFTEVQKEIYARCPHPLGVILMRRMMLRIADGLADRFGHEALITGENLGQVASQTLRSLSVVNQAARRLVLRPLVGWDKEEIIRQARTIGTYPISIEPFEDCCTLFVARHPATHPTLEAVQEAEARLDVPSLVQAAADSLEVVAVDDGTPLPEQLAGVPRPPAHMEPQA